MEALSGYMDWFTDFNYYSVGIGYFKEQSYWSILFSFYDADQRLEHPSDVDKNNLNNNINKVTWDANGGTIGTAKTTATIALVIKFLSNVIC